MSHQITIQPSGHTLVAEEDETLLAAALREGFMLPYGCRNGACGTCKGKVLSGEVDYGEFQSSALSDADIDAGKALFCVARALSDVTLECREVGAAKDIQIKTEGKTFEFEIELKSTVTEFEIQGNKELASVEIVRELKDAQTSDGITKAKIKLLENATTNRC